MPYDVAIIGGGPAGLSAALALGRARKRVLLCDSGPRRNAAAEQIHNFVTRDGTPPEEFRTIARAQLAAYPGVEVRDTRVERISGRKGAFELALASEKAEARRVVLCVGMIDEMLPIESFKELWGHAIFQCPYCHGWEVKERPWGYIARDPAMLHFAVMLRSWTDHVTVFTQGTFDVEAAHRAQLDAAKVKLETSPIARLKARATTLEGVELANGTVIECHALYAHPPQRHVDLVASLGLALDADGLVKVDPMTRETSLAGMYAAGDLTSRAQGAVFAAATGAQAAGMLNHELTAELASAVP